MMFNIHLKKNLSFVDPFRLQISASLFDDHKSFIKNVYIKNKILGETRGKFQCGFSLVVKCGKIMRERIENKSS